MDVHTTSDGTIVVIHDEKVDRTTNGKGEVHQLSIEEIKLLDAGYFWTKPNKTTNDNEFPYRNKRIKIPTLREIFENFPRSRFVIEIKQKSPSISYQLCRLITDYHLESQALVASTHGNRLKEFRQYCPNVETSMSIGESIIFKINSLFRILFWVKTKTKTIQVPPRIGKIDLVTKNFIRKAHKKNIKVQIWTVNKEEDMLHFINLGIDGIITDKPDKLLKILERKKR